MKTQDLTLTLLVDLKQFFSAGLLPVFVGPGEYFINPNDTTQVVLSIRY